ncbi:hypothetical protein Y032_0044g929 [Ancylostoma ceylanicum]|uniref:Uncharacterized protein n=1 Tax=Ancylostoma ceylanicum TaxID=53326 RepID=A0A016UEN7_9BILA|nr:hypothetical protein Y032_0044g929 [Ancylostoma ceylanicum]
MKRNVVRRIGSVNYEVEIDGWIVRKHANQLRFRDGEGHKEGSDTLKVLLEVLAAGDAYKSQGNNDEPNPDRARSPMRVYQLCPIQRPPHHRLKDHRHQR